MAMGTQSTKVDNKGGTHQALTLTHSSRSWSQAELLNWAGSR